MVSTSNPSWLQQGKTPPKLAKQPPMRKKTNLYADASCENQASITSNSISSLSHKSANTLRALSLA